LRQGDGKGDRVAFNLRRCIDDVHEWPHILGDDACGAHRAGIGGGCGACRVGCRQGERLACRLVACVVEHRHAYQGIRGAGGYDHRRCSRGTPIQAAVRGYLHAVRVIAAGRGCTGGQRQVERDCHFRGMAEVDRVHDVAGRLAHTRIAHHDGGVQRGIGIDDVTRRRNITDTGKRRRGGGNRRGDRETFDRRFRIVRIGSRGHGKGTRGIASEDGEGSGGDRRVIVRRRRRQIGRGPVDNNVGGCRLAECPGECCQASFDHRWRIGDREDRGWCIVVNNGGRADGRAGGRQTGATGSRKRKGFRRFSRAVIRQGRAHQQVGLPRHHGYAGPVGGPAGPAIGRVLERGTGIVRRCCGRPGSQRQGQNGIHRAHAAQINAEYGMRVSTLGNRRIGHRKYRRQGKTRTVVADGHYALAVGDRCVGCRYAGQVDHKVFSALIGRVVGDRHREGGKRLAGRDRDVACSCRKVGSGGRRAVSRGVADGNVRSLRTRHADNNGGRTGRLIDHDIRDRDHRIGRGRVLHDRRGAGGGHVLRHAPESGCRERIGLRGLVIDSIVNDRIAHQHAGRSRGQRNRWVRRVRRRPGSAVVGGNFQRGGIVAARCRCSRRQCQGNLGGIGAGFAKAHFEHRVCIYAFSDADIGNRQLRARFGFRYLSSRRGETVITIAREYQLRAIGIVVPGQRAATDGIGTTKYRLVGLGRRQIEGLTAEHDGRDLGAVHDFIHA